MLDVLGWEFGGGCGECVCMRGAPGAGGEEMGGGVLLLSPLYDVERI